MTPLQAAHGRCMAPAVGRQPIGAAGSTDPLSLTTCGVKT
jgi:hypothetical protein